mmetsp:Transcript_57664/g.100946  ORF Transcript_57664/g.100946 Transcript_57664/m.100946 type:complete len:327 (-) Transcript_57664:434-1414(-)
MTTFGSAMQRSALKCGIFGQGDVGTHITEHLQHLDLTSVCSSNGDISSPLFLENLQASGFLKQHLQHCCVTSLRCQLHSSHGNRIATVAPSVHGLHITCQDGLHGLIPATARTLPSNAKVQIINVHRCMPPATRYEHNIARVCKADACVRRQGWIRWQRSQGGSCSSASSTIIARRLLSTHPLKLITLPAWRRSLGTPATARTAASSIEGQYSPPGSCVCRPRVRPRHKHPDLASEGLGHPALRMSLKTEACATTARKKYRTLTHGAQLMRYLVSTSQRPVDSVPIVLEKHIPTHYWTALSKEVRHRYLSELSRKKAWIHHRHARS